MKHLEEVAGIVMIFTMIIIFVVLFAGSPDIQDAIIHKLMEGK